MYKNFKQVFLVLGCFFSLVTSAQNLISPITINLPANPPANTAEWATTLPPVMILAQTNLVNGQINGAVQESKILVYITKAGTKVCGTYSPQTAPMASFNTSVKNWSGANVLSLLGQDCTLQPGSYELCVQFYGYNGSVAGAKLLGEKCKAFTIADKKQEAESYSPPQNIFPNNGKTFTEKETKAPIVFRWTPVIPKPKEQVVYKLRVWEVEEGQNPTQARKMNSPLLEKEVKDMTQSVERIVWPPRSTQANYIWNVEASKQNQMGEVEVLGSSEPSAFRIVVGDPSEGACFSIDTSQYKIVCNGVDGNGRPIYRVKDLILKNIGTNPGRTGNSTAPATSYITSATSGVSVANITPLSAINILPNTSVNNISFDINGASGSTVNVEIHANIPLPSNPNIACNKDFLLTFDLPSCICTTCDTIKIDVTSNAPPTQNGNDVKFNQPISTLALPANTPLKIKSITAEILYVDIKKDDEQCYRCDKNSEHYGKIVKARITPSGFSQTATLPNGEAIFSTTTPTALTNANIEIQIAAPDLNRCCKDVVTVCVKYTIVTEDCKSCSVTKCYALPRTN